MSLNGCKTVKAILNSERVSSAKEQFRSLQRNDYNLSKISKADISVNIGAIDFDSLLIPAIKQSLKQKKSIANVKDYSTKNFSLHLEKEQILISTDFMVKMDTLNTSLDGKLVGTVSYSIENDTLKLYPAFNSIHINSLTYKKTRKLSRKVIASIINSVLKIFLSKLNGYMIANLPVIPLNLIDYKVSGQELAKGQDLSITLSHQLKTSTPIFYAATLINTTGLHILASIAKQPEMKDTTLVLNEENFETEFATFERNFAVRRTGFFPELPSDSNTFVAVTKDIFSSTINGSFTNDTISISYGPDNVLNGSVDKHIDFTCDDIKCGDIHIPCPGLHMLKVCKDPDFDPCNYHCGKFNAPCKIREAACKARVALERSAWFGVAKPACLLARQAEADINSGLQATCDVEELRLKGECTLIKETVLGCITGNHKFAIGVWCTLFLGQKLTKAKIGI
jgi:hypothetical protein